MSTYAEPITVDVEIQTIIINFMFIISKNLFLTSYYSMYSLVYKQTNSLLQYSEPLQQHVKAVKVCN